MTGWRTALSLGAAFFCALTAFFVVPRGFEAQSLLLAQDDPALLANHALDRSFGRGGRRPRDPVGARRARPRPRQ